jgi:endoglycosylceramidase
VSLPLLAASGTHFVDPSGNWKRLRGVNYNRIEHRTLSPASASHLQTIHGWGFNTIRFPFNWFFLESTPGDFDWSYVDSIESVVQMAVDNSLYVLIDNHQWHISQYFDTAYGSGFPEWFVVDLLAGKTTEADFWAAFWSNPVLMTSPYAGLHAWDVYADAYRVITWRLRNYTNVLGWDILNEPKLGTGMDISVFNTTTLPAFYAAVGARLRLSDTMADGKHHILVVGGQDGDIKSMMAKPALTNMVLSPHVYIASSSWTDCAAITALAHRGLDKGIAWGVPVLFGEFGANANGTGASFAQYASHTMSVNGQSWLWWSFGPQDGDTNMSLATLALQPKEAVAQLQSNINVFSGAECP